jgi:hypothetical protein
MKRDEFMEGPWSRAYNFFRVGLMVKLFLTSCVKFQVCCLQLAASVVAAAVATL